MRPLPLALLVACAGDTGLAVHNDAPEVRITSPEPGRAFRHDELVVLAAEVTDPQQATDTLELRWSSPLGGALQGDQQLDGDRVLFTVTGLAAGAHTISLLAVDDRGASGEDTVDLVVSANRRPTVHIVSPSPAGSWLEGDDLPVEIVATDDGEPSALTLSWGGAAAGAPGAPLHPDAGGEASFALSGLAPGARTLSVSVVDPHGATGSDSVTFTVIDTDLDGDGHADQAHGGDDCDDDDPHVHPGADERCNGLDDDCDGVVDEGATDPETWYRDDDGDGYGAASDTRVGCARPAGYAFASGDCDDDDPNVHPGAPERCNGLDDDCDGLVPASEIVDADADGALLCADCDDADPDVYPGAPERCNGLDDDCDGAIPSAETRDADADGFVACDDCDDDDPGVYPGAPERCDLVDQDCDGVVDESGACPGCAQQERGGRVYQFCAVDRTWDQARAACRGWGYHLVTIDGQAEQDWVHSVVNATWPETWWIGYADQLVEGSWGWEDGTPPGYERWEPGEPNNIGDEDCAAINYTLSGGWNDQACGIATSFICEGG